MRKSFDTLAQVVRDNLGQNPLSGAWFIFRGKARDRLKILYWDQDGYAIWQKWLEAGTFQFPANSVNQGCLEIQSTDLALILSGIDLDSARRRRRFALPERQAASSGNEQDTRQGQSVRNSGPTIFGPSLLGWKKGLDPFP